MKWLRHSWRAAALVALAFAGPLLHAAAPSAATAIQPYTARYQVSYRGLSGGQIEASFKPGASAGQWLYQTRAFPNLFGRIAVSPQARERSTMIVTASGVRPMTFDFNDGSSDTAADVRHEFDWSNNRVTGQAAGKPFALDVKPGTQDTASVQAAMMVERLAGRSPDGFPIITGAKLREYRYWMEGVQQVVTPFGQVAAEVWASQRIGSNRVSKIWHAPSLGYVPVQAIQYRKGSPEVQMKLVSLER